MTFREIERLVGVPLPASSRYPAWWSNNPSNNVMTQIWLDAGFRTEQVDTGAKKLVFRRVEQSTTTANGLSEPARPFARGRHPLLGALKGIVRVLKKDDLTKPADPDWGDK
jgi:hypothetical protein